VKCDPQNPGAAEIHFAEPQQDVALGQSLVVYHQNLCLGGGIIDEVRL
jgi:tRNA U34 2-thiouridine synthase MnmA/TrmU